MENREFVNQIIYNIDDVFGKFILKHEFILRNRSFVMMKKLWA